ncbi:MAG: hypothetical protein AUJ98_03645 [Bacteroidetes bacterium CG2_30_33_31]|nr:MAG: hypothetical protein AUJ98_03645 [Bacteroidetes bacterium CG2_30_33_31]
MKRSKNQTVSSLLISINEQLAEVLSSDKDISQIEIDLMKDYIRRLYDEVCTLKRNDDFDAESDAIAANSVINRNLDLETEELLNVASNQFEDKKEVFKEISNSVFAEKTVEHIVESTSENIVIDGRKVKLVDEAQSITITEVSMPKVVKSVNDVAMFGKGEKTLGDEIRKNPISSLKNNIGINDKFQFINDLFNGKMKNYNESILIFDTLQSKDKAIEYMMKLAEENKWDMKSDSVAQFNNYISRRFNY